MTEGQGNHAPRLDPKQVGSLRHIRNLAAQLPDDWSGMMGRTSLQEDFGAYRFQLAYMAYALALTHVHRLPAAPGLFRTSFAQLIDKMRSPDVWTYWHYVSTANSPFNNAHGELPAEWNPVVRDNIMYSAYLQSMALLFHYVFRDDRYAAPGALSLTYRPFFWGNGPKSYDYDEKSLNGHIYWQMVRNGYLGVACEPNCVFQICNQVPILGFRLHDLIYGGDSAGEVTQGYLRAWDEFGMLTPDGHFTMMVQEHERNAITPPAPWADFWLGTLMHAWNPDFVKTQYQRQIGTWSKPGPDGSLWIMPQPGMELDPDRHAARDFGWAAACASEVGDSDTLDRLFAYADRFLHPAWIRGGYHFRRDDRLYDDDGHFTCMDPHTGNALLGYARLNVPDGLRKLYDGPLDDGHFEAPCLDDMSPELDIFTAWFDRQEDVLTIIVAPMVGEEGKRTNRRLAFAHVDRLGRWQLCADGERLVSGDGLTLLECAGGVQAEFRNGLLDITLPIPVEITFRLTPLR